MASIPTLYAVVRNIPRSYHSRDLRNFFSRFIEKDGFHCFHFRHRPEARGTEQRLESSSESTQKPVQEKSHGLSSKKNSKLSSTCCCVITLPESKYGDLTQMYDSRHWITEKGESMRSVCQISKIKISSKSAGSNTEPQYKTRLEQSLVSPDREEFYEEDLNNLVELNPPTVMPKGNVGTPTLVFLDLIRQCLLPPKIISKLKLKFPKTMLNNKYGNVPFNYEVFEQPELDLENSSVCWLPVRSSTGHELVLQERGTEEEEQDGTIHSVEGEEDVRSVAVVDNCSVGSKQRILESGVLHNSGREMEEKGNQNKEEEEEDAELVKGRDEIEEGGSDQKKQRSQCEESELHREGMVEEMEHIRRENNLEREKKKERWKESGCIKEKKRDKMNKEDINKEKVRLFRNGISKDRHSETQNLEITEQEPKTSDNKNPDEESMKKITREMDKYRAKVIKKQEMAARRKKMALRIEEKMIEYEQGSDRSENDADECEEWERHEALHDDPSNQERNEERLFEHEIELKWEKGGSGLVFYTDAQFWKQQEGDFDEQTADDWDVDMSGYYEPGAGDMDGRDLIRIRRDQRRRDGIDDEHGMVAGIGKFEKHTKGFGRKIMERQGWKEGEGLGPSTLGIAEALTNDGQNPRCKTGFGFQEPKRGRKADGYYKKQELKEWHGPIISTVYDDPSVTDPVDPLLRRNEPYQLKRRKTKDIS